MKATAWGANHHEKNHSIARDAMVCRMDSDRNGSASITFQSDEIELGRGSYYFKFELSAAEIDALYRKSFLGMTKDKESQAGHAKVEMAPMRR